MSKLIVRLLFTPVFVSKYQPLCVHSDFIFGLYPLTLNIHKYMCLVIGVEQLAPENMMYKKHIAQVLIIITCVHNTGANNQGRK